MTLNHSQAETVNQKYTLEKFTGDDRHSHPHHQLQTGVPADQPPLNHPPDKTGRWSDELPHGSGDDNRIVVEQLKVVFEGCHHQLQLISEKASPVFIQCCTFPDLPPLLPGQVTLL